MDPIVYVPYLSLATYSISLIGEVISVFVWFVVLKSIYKLNRLPSHYQMSPFFVAYSLICLLESFFAIFYCLYMILMWRPVMWIFIPCLIFMSILQISLCFLTLERALLLHFPTTYSSSHQLKLLYLMAICFAIIAGINVGFHLADFYENPNKKCWSAGCLLTTRGANVYTFCKFGFTFLNIIGSIYFFYSLKNFNKMHNFSPDHVTKKRRINNLLTIYTIIIDFIFNFLPYLITFTITAITGIQVNQYLGPYTTILTAFDTLISAFLFVSQMKKLEKAHFVPIVPIMARKNSQRTKSSQIHPTKS